MQMFIAIHFDMFTHADTKRTLIKLRDELKEKCSTGSFTPHEDLNIILAKLGNCDETQRIAAISAMFDAANEINLEPFTLETDRIDKLTKENGETWQVRFRESKPLTEYMTALTGLLTEKGFDIGKDEFIPHVELGRGIQSKAEPFSPEPPFETKVEKIDLMKLRHGCCLVVHESVNTCKLTKKG